MSELTVIRQLPPAPTTPGREIELVTDRATLAKRRWRGTAEDGREFGFDLEQAFPPGAVFFHEDACRYVLTQEPEEVIEIPVAGAEQAARVAWNLGNLHFGVQILPVAVRVPDDPAVRQLLAREGVSYRRVTCLFQPLAAAAHPHHHENE